MGMTPPQKYIARVSDKYCVSENEKYVYIKFELVSPDRISFEAGQYVSIKINEAGERRSYSIASTPSDDHGFHLLVEIVEGGKGSNFLNNLVVGQEVEVLAPMGQFVVNADTSARQHINTCTRENVETKLLFVATGSGIVPLWSMINDQLITKSEKRQMRLHWGMRSEDDLFFVDKLERLANEHSNFVYDVVLSKPSLEWGLCSGHVQDCLERDFGPKAGLVEWEAYVCGRPEMIEAVSSKMIALGMLTQNIHHEKYT